MLFRSTDPGTYAVQIKNTKSSTTTAAGLRQKIGRPGNPGEHYQLTAWVKAIGGSGQAQATITRDAGTSGCTSSASQSSTINIGTSGQSGSTTNVTIGTSTGTITTTIYGANLAGGGTTTTSAADTNTTAIASTAFVVGQAGSATPLVDGTAAVGTSLRYARQDHVHPTDTSRAALASPTLDRKSTRLNSSHSQQSRMPSSA